MKRKIIKEVLMMLVVITFAAASAAAATFTATNTNNSGAGSLRQAILDSNASSGTDTINFDASFNVPRTITVTSGEMLMTNGGGITINGPGRNLLTISGNNQSRAFEINSYDAAITVVINNLTFSNCAVLTSGTGNGVTIDINRDGNPSVHPFQITDLTLNNVAVVNVTTANVGGNYNIYSRSQSNITINNSYIGNNSGTVNVLATGGNASTRKLIINNSTIEKNLGNNGGLISVTADDVDIINSTISDNIIERNGILRIDTDIGRVFNLINSTVVRNFTIDGGPAITFSASGSGPTNAGVANVTNSTIAFNKSNAGAVSGAPYAGFYAASGTGTVNLKKLILANNTNLNAGNDLYVDQPGGFYALNSSYSLVRAVAANSLPVSAAGGNVVGVDPLLDGALLNYGGATKTLALRKGSPAIDTGDPTTFQATDQRGISRPQDGDGNGAARSDMGAYERRPTDFIVQRIADFDNDGLSDLSVFRPSNGVWYLNRSTDGFTGLAFGDSNDKLVPADYDGKTDVAVFRPSNGYWYLRRNSLGFIGLPFGAAGDFPVPGDYDGGDKTDLAVFRPSNGVWYLQRSSQGFTGILYGVSTDRPVPTDYDGDGKPDLAVNRSGNWYIQRSQLGFVGVGFGDGSDKTVPADYDGDGKTDIAVFRPSNGVWYLLQSTAGFASIGFGLGTDIPVAADYDGDGRADVAVVRNGNWHLNRSTQGFTGILFGTNTDLPIPNAFVR